MQATEFWGRGNEVEHVVGIFFVGFIILVTLLFLFVLQYLQYCYILLYLEIFAI